jgi:hypothetical protein
VKVGHLEQISQAGLEPIGLLFSLALRAVTVTTGVIRDLLVPTLLTPLKVSTQGGSAAGHDILKNPALLG